VTDNARTPLGPLPPEAPFDEVEQASLGEDVDIDDEARRKILTIHRDLTHLDHYALLAVDRAADRKAIKRAYFDAAALFHPDRYFRKRLGSFKPRLETIFSRITVAHETLSDPDRRAEYDVYLRARERTQSIENALSDAFVEAERVRTAVEREAGVEPEKAPALNDVPQGSQPLLSNVQAPSVDTTVRRDAFARRLLGGRARTSGESPSPSRPPDTLPALLSTADAMALLKQRYEQRVAAVRLAHARQYVARGEASLASGDAVSAANALRVAVGLTPGNADLERRALDAQSRAEALLRDAYSKQAGYEEKTGQFAEAARSWTRVCEIASDDAEAHERAATALAQARGDLKEAVRLARRACSLDPNNARRRVALVNVYIAAGLTENARQEIQTALQLSPSDGTMLAMMKRLGVSG
jgi:tetratricopeptide (TPR) repeat protein